MEKILALMSRQQFSPLCDLHHTSLHRLMLEEELEDIRAYYACDRRGCIRVFRDSNGYSDWIDGEFDDSRASRRICRRCEGALYPAGVDRLPEDRDVGVSARWMRLNGWGELTFVEKD